jgi:hypothetical protein
VTVTYDMLSKAADRLHDSEVAVKKKLAVFPNTHPSTHTHARAHTHPCRPARL